MMPTTLELNLQAGQYRADRDRLVALVLAIEEGFSDGTATTHWQALLRAARWMRQNDARGDHNGTR